jgi:16S rRNA (uracil1498-N3)-methyltransferase
MYNFFVNNEQISENKVNIVGEDFNHIVNVLRMKKGDKIYICNKENSESFLAEIDNILNDSVQANILEKNFSTESNVEITIYQGLPKSEKMEYIIQKSTELGASVLVPVNMKYCISKLKDEEKKHDRWQKIAEVAAKQSKRNIIPRIEKLVNVSDICNRINDYDLVIIAYENEENINMKNVLSESKNPKKIAIVIGPEGGLSKEEVEKMKNAGAKIVSLGNRILRTETASTAMLSMIMYEYEF